jgi:5-methylcytosine-specific restriction endonuclease McrA
MRCVTRSLAIAVLAVAVTITVLSGISYAYRSDRCADCPRDAKGDIAQDKKVTRQFEKENPCPGPDYEEDHKIPLKCGGPDTTANLQWLSKEQHKIKTASEWKDCP